MHVIQKSNILNIKTEHVLKRHAGTTEQGCAGWHESSGVGGPSPDGRQRRECRRTTKTETNEKRKTYLTVRKQDDAARQEDTASWTRSAPSACTATATGSAVKATSCAWPTYSAPCSFPLGKSCPPAPSTMAALPVQLQCPQHRDGNGQHPGAGGTPKLESSQF